MSRDAIEAAADRWHRSWGDFLSCRMTAIEILDALFAAAGVDGPGSVVLTRHEDGAVTVDGRLKDLLVVRRRENLSTNHPDGAAAFRLVPPSTTEETPT